MRMLDDGASEKEVQRHLDQTRQTERPRPVADGETYLRLAALDLEDEDAILRFVNAYGPLGVRLSDMDAESDLVYRGFVLEPDSKRVVNELLATREAAEEAADDVVEETIHEFRFGARCLRDLLTAWRVCAGELVHEEASWVADCWPVRDRSPRLNDDPWERRGPARLLTMYLCSGLNPFSPRVIDSDGADLLTQIECELYDVLCLELYNHIVAHAFYRHCANERCGRLFVRQSGRAEHGQHRSSGVRYCSATCARAQAQRAYRRRRARVPPT
jgi:hypothetical protein